MKTVVDISEEDLEAARKLTGAGTHQEAIAKAVAAFLHGREERRRMISQLCGSIPDIITQEELQRLRRDS